MPWTEELRIAIANAKQWAARRSGLPVVEPPRGDDWDAPGGDEESGLSQTRESEGTDRDAADEEADTVPGWTPNANDGGAEWLDVETGLPAQGASTPCLREE